MFVNTTSVPVFEWARSRFGSSFGLALEVSTAVLVSYRTQMESLADLFVMVRQRGRLADIVRGWRDVTASTQTIVCRRIFSLRLKMICQRYNLPDNTFDWDPPPEVLEAFILEVTKLVSECNVGIQINDGVASLCTLRHTYSV